MRRSRYIFATRGNKESEGKTSLADSSGCICNKENKKEKEVNSLLQ